LFKLGDSKRREKALRLKREADRRISFFLLMLLVSFQAEAQQSTVQKAITGF
jgi:hypothetical protein